MKKNGRYLIRMLLLSFLLAIAVPGICGAGSVGKVEAKASLNKKKASIKLNKTVTLKVKGATKSVQWKSSKPNVVKIKKISGKKKQNVVLQGVAKGKSVITAKIGKTKLKATITVKHTHSYTTPATCTSPAKCACGATYGPILGHSWVAGNCITPAKCSRCGAVGSLGGHSYNLNHVCGFCHSVELNQLLDLSFEKGVGNFIWLYYENYAEVEWVTDNYKIYPDNGLTGYGLTVASDDGATVYSGWTYMAEDGERGRLNIPVNLTVWNMPRLEFDVYCTVTWSTGSITTSADQTYHVKIVGDGTDPGSNRKTYTYTRIK